MRLNYKILFIGFFLLSCNKSINKGGKHCELNMDSVNLKLNKHYNSDIDFSQFLLKKEKDSILKIWCESIVNVDSSNTYFLDKIYIRKLEIMGLIASLQDTYSENKTNIPLPFMRYLLDEELQGFIPDSINHMVELNELMKKRSKKVYKTILFNDFLTNSDIKILIKNSFRDSVYYNELALNRYKKDSTVNIKLFNKRKDSIQSIIFPIDSVLPFGPKSLGKMIEKNAKILGFSVKKGDSLTPEQKKNRKSIYEIWTYFLKLHPFADEDLAEGYIEKLIPSVKSFKFINLGIDIPDDVDDFYFDPKYTHFQARIQNIGIYEVYYATTANDYPYDCGGYQKEEDCCFAHDGYDCNSVGYIVLYDRKKEYAVFIPAFLLYNSDSYGFMIQFFYIKNNIIYVYQGFSAYDRFISDIGELEHFSDQEEITDDAEGYKSVKIIKSYEIKISEEGVIKTKVNNK